MTPNQQKARALREEGYSFPMIGKELGVSRQRAQQLCRAAYSDRSPLTVYLEAATFARLREACGIPGAGPRRLRYTAERILTAYLMKGSPS
jgi:hypothetical protein